MSDDTDERGEEYVARQRGGDHLPECPAADTTKQQYACFCDRLRACEARVLSQFVDGVDEVSFRRGLEALRVCKNRALAEAAVRINAEHSTGFAAGLDAAREAVAAVEPLYDPFPVFPQGPVVYRHHALAAIDALRGAE